MTVVNILVFVKERAVPSPDSRILQKYHSNRYQNFRTNFGW